MCRPVRLQIGIVLAATVAGVAGCNPHAQVSVTGGSGDFTVGDVPTRVWLTLFGTKNAVVLWSDARQSTGHLESSTSGAIGSGAFVTSKGDKIEWSLRSKTGYEGNVTVGESSYDLLNGNVLLLKISKGKFVVKQIARPIPDRSVDWLAKNDSEIKEFFHANEEQ